MTEQERADALTLARATLVLETDHNCTGMQTLARALLAENVRADEQLKWIKTQAELVKTNNETLELAAQVADYFEKSFLCRQVAAAIRELKESK